MARVPEGPQRPARTAGGSELMRRVFARLRVARTSPQAPLQPPGSRSGAGSDSLGPYLEESRNTRPTPLE